MASSYEVLGQVNPSVASLTTAYTVPASTQAVLSSIMIANRSATPTSFRIAIVKSGAGADDKQYIAYDTPVLANDSIAFSVGVTLDTGDIVKVYAAAATLSFNIFGEEIS